MALNIRDQTVLQSAAERLDELISACAPRGPVYSVDPALAADVTRKAKALRTSLGKLREAVDDSHHRPVREELLAKRKDPLYMRINREPVLYELARAVSYGGVRSGQLRDRMAEMSEKYGSGAVALAFSELTMTDPATHLTVLRPEARKVCSQIMGPAPESPGYAAYWAERGREPPPEHKPPEPGKSGTAQPMGETPPTPQEQPPKRPWRYEPSDEALEAFERLEGWLRGADDKPVDHEAADTLRVLARALLEGMKGWHHAAEARLQSLQTEPPAYVPNKDLMAFDEALDDLLDGLHEVMLTGRRR